MQEHWNSNEYREYVEKLGKRSKYNARKTEIDGYTFASQKEANYYCELKMRLKAEEIAGFAVQCKFILAPRLIYIADFVVFYNDKTTEIIDTKGFRTKEYIAKKKIFEDKFNLKIKEV